MPQANIERWQSLKTLPALIANLRDELDRPIETEDVEDLTFEYRPQGLGHDAAAGVGC